METIKIISDEKEPVPAIIGNFTVPDWKIRNIIQKHMKFEGQV